MTARRRVDGMNSIAASNAFPVRFITIVVLFRIRFIIIVAQPVGQIFQDIYPSGFPVAAQRVGICSSRGYCKFAAAINCSISGGISPLR